jgi:hypothetical protein
MEATMGNDNHLGDFPETSRDTEVRPGERHPLRGALKDITFILPGVDLTEPADPDWGKVCEDGSPDEAKRDQGQTEKT